MIGIKLADDTYIPGACGQSDNRLELVLTTENTLMHLNDLMDPEKTKWIGYYVDELIAEYEGYTQFAFMQPDNVSGKMDVWLKKP